MFFMDTLSVTFRMGKLPSLVDLKCYFAHYRYAYYLIFLTLNSYRAFFATRCIALPSRCFPRSNTDGVFSDVFQGYVKRYIQKREAPEYMADLIRYPIICILHTPMLSLNSRLGLFRYVMYRLVFEAFTPIPISMGRFFWISAGANIRRNVSIGTDRCVISALRQRCDFFLRVSCAVQPPK